LEVESIARGSADPSAGLTNTSLSRFGGAFEE
jgi:hypothetical protein